MISGSLTPHLANLFASSLPIINCVGSDFKYSYVVWGEFLMAIIM
jgi:hypothetical protein